MKLILLPLLLALSGCGLAPLLSGFPTAPAVVADQTAVDEQAALGVELAYQASAKTIKVAVSVGLIHGDTALRVAELDNKAYRAVLATRAAYDAGNAQSYGAAAQKANTLIGELLLALPQ